MNRKPKLDKVRGKQISIRGISSIEDVLNIKNSINRHLHFTLIKDRNVATERDFFFSVAYSVRDQLSSKWIRTQQYYYDTDPKRVYYFSLEFFIGKLLRQTMINLNIKNEVDEASYQLGLNIEDLEEIEEEAGLGNGGLGRLAACYLDSMASLGLAGYGYGLRYDYGLFTQEIIDGYQVERPDEWLKYGNPWEKARPEYTINVQFYGRLVKEGPDVKWIDTEIVHAIPFDTPVAGFGNDTVNTLRLFSAFAKQSFNLQFFNDGEYIQAVLDRNNAENITRVLYPNERVTGGRELRIKQEYFLVSASLQDILRRFKASKFGHKHPIRKDLRTFPEKVAIQLNDSHPSFAIPELMRLLIDQEGLDWDTSWEITQETFGFTNHTLAPEALERWDVELLDKIVPRHMDIINNINKRFLEKIAQKYPNDPERLKKMSIIQDGKVIMTYLSIVGSHAVNGVSKIHSQLLCHTLCKEFYQDEPHKFQNKTNGITPRRWLLCCNPNLADLIQDYIGIEWLEDLEKLKDLLIHKDKPNLLRNLRRVKCENKMKLAKYLLDEFNIHVDTSTMFDVQVKRIHEYKRQMLNLLHVITRYNMIKADPNIDLLPRVVLIGGKAAPGYCEAKKIIKLINNVANVINNDPLMKKRLQLIFLPDYKISMAERIIPAGDLSEQISLAGTEASGTGNMKFMLNGAITIGTLDGANVEIYEEVGDENMFLFGMRVEDVEDLRENNKYDPKGIYEKNENLKLAIDQIKSGYYSPENPNLFHDVLHRIFDQGDPFMVLGDYEDYVRRQFEVDALYRDPMEWSKRCLINIAHAGKFSSDRSIKEYASDIWNVKPTPFKIPIDLEKKIAMKLSEDYNEEQDIYPVLY